MFEFSIYMLIDQKHFGIRSNVKTFGFAVASSNEFVLNVLCNRGSKRNSRAIAITKYRTRKSRPLPAFVRRKTNFKGYYTF